MANMPRVPKHATVNGLDHAYLDANPQPVARVDGGHDSAPLAVCLHGFPDTAWGWQPLLDALAGAGFRAVAPFMRGYAPTAVPPDGSSPLAAWVADVDALHEAFDGDDRAVLIGHDWGAMAAYGAASFAPAKWRRVVTASIPPISVMADRLFDYDQLKRFWYQHLFRQSTAETIVAYDDFAFLTRLWSDWSPGYDATEALAHVRDALREPAHLTAALSTYRTLYDPSGLPSELTEQQMAVFSPHTQPTLYLHGAADGCVAADVIEPTRAVLPEGSLAKQIDGAGHFVQYEQPDTVNRLIIEFLTA